MRDLYAANRLESYRTDALTRLFDITLALLSLPPTLPLKLLIGLIMRRRLGSPVLFRQVRPALGGALFRMARFRSMNDARDESGEVLSGRMQLTTSGHRLRSGTLNELPTLWIVHICDMSIIGPCRPLMDCPPLYSQTQARRHEVRRRVTGWSKVNRRNGIGWDENLAREVWYVEHRTLLLNVTIRLCRIGKVFRRNVISAVAKATMPRFEGSAMADVYES